MNKPVTKAIIAAAGFGTRFLPQTKAMPKEMLPLVDKPIIQYVVEELVGAGIKDIIIVSGYSKRAIEDHFDAPNAELSSILESKQKIEELESLHAIADLANFVYVRQKKPLGNAAPLLYASHLVNDEPFIYTWGDDFIAATPSRFQQMVDIYERTGSTVVPCIRLTDDSQYDRYGIVAGEPRGAGLLKMSTIVEKPGKAAAPSDLASVSGYLFTPEILGYVDKAAAEHTGEDELKIQTAMQAMIDDGFEYLACEVANATYYDAGDKLEYIKTVIDFALARDDIGPELQEFLQAKALHVKK